MIDINSRAYCKTRHVDRMWNFKRNYQKLKRVTAGLPKMYPGFLKMYWFPEILFQFHENHNVSQFPKTVSQFPANVSKFPDLYETLYVKRY